MIIASAIVTLYDASIQSLKEKRSRIKRLTSRLRQKFNASVAEVDAHDVHQSLVIGLALVVSDTAYGDRVIEAMLKEIESGSEAEVVEVLREFR